MKEVIVAITSINKNIQIEFPFVRYGCLPINIWNLITEFLQCEHQCLNDFLVIRLENERKM